MIKISIRYKLLLSFLLLTLCIVVMSVYTITVSNRTKSNFISIVDRSFPRLQALQEMKIVSININSLITNFNNDIITTEPNSNTPTPIGATKDLLLSYLSDIQKWQEIYQANLKEDEKNSVNLQELTKLRGNVVIASLGIFAAKEKKASPRQIDQLKKNLSFAQTNLDRFIKQGLVSETNTLLQKKEDTIQSTENLYKATIILNLLIIAIAVIISLLLTNFIAKPIIKLKNFAQSVTQNNLDVRAPVETNDEIGDLSISLNNMLDNLSKAETKLIEASRAAGTAEVATSILHNVGNVLNSINVSVTVINEIINKTTTTQLKKIDDLIEEKKSDLSNFLMNDERGKYLLPYLIKLHRQFEDEQIIIKEETHRLKNNLNHVNNIIDMQQSYGRSRGIIEPIQLTELIKTACSINSNKIISSGIKIEYHLDEIHSFRSVKSKIQQILVNLTRNAIEAVLENNNMEKKIIITMTKIDNNVIIAISDNGIGISSENLEKIFKFGFTTKKNGHGYGMHNSALLANELGGKLSAHSEGLGKGATFTLELPNLTKRKLAKPEVSCEVS